MEAIRRVHLAEPGRLRGRQPTPAGVRVDGERERSYWLRRFETFCPRDSGWTFEELEPAFRYGWESRAAYPGRSWEEAVGDLLRGWETGRKDSSLTWDEACPAVEAAWRHAGAGA